MPLYDYECKCGMKFEEFRPIADRATAPCPRCGKDAGKTLSNFFAPSSGSKTSRDPGGCGPGGFSGG